MIYIYREREGERGRERESNRDNEIKNGRKSVSDMK